MSIKKSVIMVLAFSFNIFFPSPGHSNEQSRISQKTKCVSMFDFNFRKLQREEIEEYLLNKIKIQAAVELFGDIAKYKNNQHKKYYYSKILGLVRVNGTPTLRPGKSPGDVCMSIDAFAYKRDITSIFEVKKKKKLCHSDRRVTQESLEKQTKNKAITDLLIEYNPKLIELDFIKLRSLLRIDDLNAHYEKDGRYCVDLTGTFSPYEVDSALSYKFDADTSESNRQKFSKFTTESYLIEVFTPDYQSRKGFSNFFEKHLVHKMDHSHVVRFYVLVLDGFILSKSEGIVYSIIKALSLLDGSALQRYISRLSKSYINLTSNNKHWPKTMQQFEKIINKIGKEKFYQKVKKMKE